MPLRMFEVGSSAGLNLRWDAFSYRSGGFEFGDPASPVQFADFMASGSPPVPARVEVAERAGCDPRPVDLLSDDGVLTLRSYLWADQLDRLELLDGAIAVAREVPVDLEQADTVEWLGRRLDGAEPGSCRVVFHSIVMQYVEEGERERIGAAIAEAGERATAESPLARLALEPGGDEAELRLTMWPGGEQRVLANAGYHGAPVTWLR